MGKKKAIIIKDIRLYDAVERYKGKYLIFKKYELDDWKNDDVKGDIILLTENESLFWKAINKHSDNDIFASFVSKDCCYNDKINKKKVLKKIFSLNTTQNETKFIMILR